MAVRRQGLLEEVRGWAVLPLPLPFNEQLPPPRLISPSPVSMMFFALPQAQEEKSRVQA